MALPVPIILAMSTRVHMHILDHSIHLLFIGIITAFVMLLHHMKNGQIMLQDRG